MTVLTALETRILDDWQRDFPLVPRPFKHIAETLGTTVEDLLSHLKHLQTTGTMARVGATCRPNTLGKSTLAALSVPDWRVEEVAQIVGAERGVNHSYLREHDWNLWFVATAPDAADLAHCLARIEERTGLEVLSLPLKRAFNIDLGFRLEGPRHALSLEEAADLSVIGPKDRALTQALTNGLPLQERPYARLGERLGMSEDEVLERLRVLTEARIITRMGVIVRHRALGWRSNAMVTWDLPDERIEAAGRALVRHPGVTLCYERVRRPGKWDHPLFCMIHAKSRSEAQGILADAAAMPELEGARYQVLFSVRCFKQTGAMVDRPREVAA